MRWKKKKKKKNGKEKSLRKVRNEMPTSGMKFVNIRGDKTLYVCLAFKFGGSEPSYEKTGYRRHVYIGAVLLLDEPKLLVDTVDGAAYYAISKAGLCSCPVLEAGWAVLLRDFDAIESGSTIEVELTSGEPRVCVRNELVW